MNPSGDQYWLEADDQEASVVEVGGGLRTYTVAGVDVLDGYSVDEMAAGGRGQNLIPWPNRIEDGKYSFAGEDLQLALTEPGRHNASHGLVRWANWTATAHEGDRVVMELVLHPQPGYPFTLGLAVEYRLGPGGPLGGHDGHQPGRPALPVRRRRPPVPHRGHGAGSTTSCCWCRPSTYLWTDERGIPTGAAARPSAHPSTSARPGRSATW